MSMNLSTSGRFESGRDILYRELTISLGSSNNDGFSDIERRVTTYVHNNPYEDNTRLLTLLGSIRLTHQTTRFSKLETNISNLRNSVEQFQSQIQSEIQSLKNRVIRLECVVACIFIFVMGNYFFNSRSENSFF